MKNINIKNITTEEEAGKYFMSEEDIDLMQFIDMDEVQRGVEQAEREIAN